MPHDPNHPVFKAPSNAEAPLWRYIDFTKFVALLEGEALFFSRADLLGDPFEGSFSQVNVQLRPIWAEQEGIPTDAYSGLEESRRKMVQQTFINAWHLSEGESAAMWSLYLRSEDGIAIKSTYSRLSEAFAEASETVYIGLVSYIDYERTVIPEGNTFWPFVHKRQSYEHEREVRAVIQAFEYFENMRAREEPATYRAARLEQLGIEDSPELDVDAVFPLPPPGLAVPVHLGRLIEEVYVAPNAASWFSELVESVMRRYGRPEPVRQSSLGVDPVY